MHYLWSAFVCFLIRSHPPSWESNALGRAIAGVVFAPFGVRTAVQDLNGLTCFRNFWSVHKGGGVGRWPGGPAPSCLEANPRRHSRAGPKSAALLSQLLEAEFWRFLSLVVHEDQPFSEIWGWGWSLRGTDCCPVTHLHPLLVLWGWGSGNHLTTCAFMTHQSPLASSCSERTTPLSELR